MRLDPNRPFIPLKCVVVTLSDTRTEDSDTSGQYLVQALTEGGHTLVDKMIIPDHRENIIAALRESITNPNIDVVLCTGGTGLTGRDQTPEALEAVVEKWIPGFGELFRWLSYQKIGTSTIQSRACAGLASGTLIFALPGSPSACRDAWTGILAAQLNSQHRPCNFAELLPRLQESPIRRK
ncbi:MAG: molybdenum cofactor biosynthesis protein B [Myxococcota bacterium]|nr:molybdenum cofactor biosynthesis protein B [Myxococcota bacterium]